MKTCYSQKQSMNKARDPNEVSVLTLLHHICSVVRNHGYNWFETKLLETVIYSNCHMNTCVLYGHHPSNNVYSFQMLIIDAMASYYDVALIGCRYPHIGCNAGGTTLYIRDNFSFHFCIYIVHLVIDGCFAW